MRRGPALSGPVDDLAQKFFESDVWASGTVSAADRMYDQVMVRFEKDREEIVEKLVADAAPKVKKELHLLLNDVDTQAAVDRASADVADRFRNGMILAAVATLVGTFFIVKFVR